MTFVIAELGVNWRNLNEADEMIREAAAAGVDAAKFQAYTVDQVIMHDRNAELRKIMLDESAIRYLYWRCQAARVQFMCTPMYVEAVAMLDPYVNRWKVRCFDWNNHELLDAINKTDPCKEVLISIENPELLKYKCPRYKMLYCCPEYPPDYEPVALDFRGFDGYSCHIPSPIPAGMVKLLNLEYLEVHVKRDHYPDAYCPIDNLVSITMSELAELCRRVK